MIGYHIAQANIALLRAPLTDPDMAEFITLNDEINAIAAQTPGFVWQLKTGDITAPPYLVFNDPRILLNVSVWESADALFQFVYQGDHLGAFRRRAEWFLKPTRPHLVLWWTPAGEFPTSVDAEAKLRQLEDNGPTPLAFTFKQRFTIDEMRSYVVKETT
jgi:hypothetical protein